MAVVGFDTVKQYGIRNNNVFPSKTTESQLQIALHWNLSTQKMKDKNDEGWRVNETPFSRWKDCEEIGTIRIGNRSSAYKRHSATSLLTLQVPGLKSFWLK